MKENWKKKRIEQCFKVKSGDFLPANKMVKAGSVDVYGGNGIAGKHDQHNLTGENIIIGRVGAKCGNVKRVSGNIWVTDNAFYISEFIEEFDLPFLEYLLSIKNLRDTANQTAQPVISYKTIKNVILVIPPLPEQKRIVAILDEAFEGIDRAIANTEKNLANARELFESYLNTVFTKRDSIPTVAIGDIGEVFDGPHATPKTIDSGPIFLGISSLQNGTIKLEKTRHVSPEDFQKWTRRVQPRTEDIVFSYETRIGQAAIIPEGLECCLGRRMGLVRVDKTKIEPLYFLYLYLSPPFQSFLNEKIIRGATVDRISIKEFPSFTIPLPSLDKQKSIVSSVNLLSTETQRLETIYRQKVVALNELKQSILQKAFTGELTADTANQTTKAAQEVSAA